MVVWELPKLLTASGSRKDKTKNTKGEWSCEHSLQHLCDEDCCYHARDSRISPCSPVIVIPSGRQKESQGCRARNTSAPSEAVGPTPTKQTHWGFQIENRPQTKSTQSNSSLKGTKLLLIAPRLLTDHLKAAAPPPSAFPTQHGCLSSRPRRSHPDEPAREGVGCLLSEGQQRRSQSCVVQGGIPIRPKKQSQSWSLDECSMAGRAGVSCATAPGLGTWWGPSWSCTGPWEALMVLTSSSPFIHQKTFLLQPRGKETSYVLPLGMVCAHLIARTGKFECVASIFEPGNAVHSLVFKPENNLRR